MALDLETTAFLKRKFGMLHITVHGVLGGNPWIDFTAEEPRLLARPVGSVSHSDTAERTGQPSDLKHDTRTAQIQRQPTILR